MLNEWLQSFASYAWVVYPWLFIGFFIALFIEKIVSPQRIRKYLGYANLKTILIAHVIGMISPLSILSFLPVAGEFVRLGASPNVFLSYLMAERAYDLQSFFIISGFFGLKVAILNFLAILAGVTVAALAIKDDKMSFGGNEKMSAEMSKDFIRSQVRLLIYATFGLALAALIKTVFKPEWLLAFKNGIVATCAALMFGFLFYFGTLVNNYPVAKSFADLGMANQAVFAFLTISPILNLVVLLMFQSVTDKK